MRHTSGLGGLTSNSIPLTLSRYWTGLDVYKDPEYAIELLLRVCATPANDKSSGARFRQTQARARSTLAAMLLGTLGDLSNAVATVGARGSVAFGESDGVAGVAGAAGCAPGSAGEGVAGELRVAFEASVGAGASGASPLTS